MRNLKDAQRFLKDAIVTLEDAQVDYKNNRFRSCVMNSQLTIKHNNDDNVLLQPCSNKDCINKKINIIKDPFFFIL